mgnify:CR=1 FL=1
MNELREMIKVENLNKSFGDLHVLKDINLTVYESDVVCLLGSSGSGKSTLLRCLNYLEKNKYLIPQSRTYLDFIQFICALGGKRFYIEQNKKKTQGHLKIL